MYISSYVLKACVTNFYLKYSPFNLQFQCEDRCAYNLTTVTINVLSYTQYVIDEYKHNNLSLRHLKIIYWMTLSLIFYFL